MLIILILEKGFPKLTHAYYLRLHLFLFGFLSSSLFRWSSGRSAKYVTPLLSHILGHKHFVFF